jgi:hypothetical protein
MCQSQIHVDTGFDVYNPQQSEIETPGPSCIVSDFEVVSTFPSITSGGTISTASVTPPAGEPGSWPFDLYPIYKDRKSLHLLQSTGRNSHQTRRHGNRTTSSFSLHPPTSKPPMTQTALLPSMSQLPGDLRPWTAEKSEAGSHHDGSHSALSYDYSLEYKPMFGTVNDWL